MPNDITPEGAAMELLRLVAFSESKNININAGNAHAPTKQWLLWTYAQCLSTVRDPQKVDVILQLPEPDPPTK